MRVQIPAYTDQWMRGDRYGTVVSITTICPTGIVPTGGTLVYGVKLDKSGKTLKFIADDCQEV